MAIRVHNEGPVFTGNAGRVGVAVRNGWARGAREPL
jgi:hypothetical protein